jgi:hypothetical protein
MGVPTDQEERDGQGLEERDVIADFKECCLSLDTFFLKDKRRPDLVTEKVILVACPLLCLCDRVRYPVQRIIQEGNNRRDCRVGSRVRVRDVARPN